MSDQNELNLEGENTPNEELNTDYVSFQEKPPLADLSDLKTPPSENEIVEDEESIFDLTIDEKKKYLRAMGKNLTDDEILTLPEEEVEKIKEYVKLKDKKAIIKFVTRKKYVTDEEANAISEEDFEKITKKALVMSKFLTYNSKKHYGVAYKKERARKNREASKLRKINPHRKH